MLLPEYMTQAESERCPHCGMTSLINRAYTSQGVEFWWCNACDKGFHIPPSKPYTTVKLTTVSQWEEGAACWLPDEEGNFTRHIDIAQQVFNEPIWAVGLSFEEKVAYCLPDAPMLLVQHYCAVCQHPLYRNDWFCEVCDDDLSEAYSE